MSDIGHWYRCHVMPNKAAFVSVARRLLGDSDAAQDVVQDVLADLISDDRWKVIPEPRMYIFRSIYNRCISHLRRLKVVPMYSLSERDDHPFADDAPDPLQILESKDKMAKVRRAIDTLPPRIKVVFALRTIESLSIQEISERLGTNETLIRRQVKRGRVLLRQALRAQGVDAGEVAAGASSSAETTK